MSMFNIACDNQKNENRTNVISMDFERYPESAYICFDRQLAGSRQKEFKLGDSCSTFGKYFNLDCAEIIPGLGLEMMFETRGEFGSTFTKIRFEVDKKRRLNSFTATWTHAKSFDRGAREEFYKVVQNNSMSCLWEESLKIYNPKDSLSWVYFDKYTERFVSDFSGHEWTIEYTCRLK